MKKQNSLPPEIRSALDGVVPFVIGSTAADGTPNITFMSQLFYVDEEHVALSYQFMNKTWRNLQVNPVFTAVATRPDDISMWKLVLEYVEQQTAGPIFEEMEMQLMALATPQNINFSLHAALICRLLSVEKIFDGLSA